MFFAVSKMLKKIDNNNKKSATPNKKPLNIYSEQPWFVLSAAKHYDFLVPEDSSISHFYTFEADQLSSTAFAIPDGATDIFFDCDQENPSVKICGSTLQAKDVQLEDKHRYFGVRFVAGVLPSFLKLVADDVVNQEISLIDLLPEKQALFSQIASHPSFLNQVSLYQNFFNTKPPSEPSALIKKLLYKIYKTKGSLPIRKLEELTGYTSRTLQRQFQKDLGMSPKTFSRIVRGQIAIHNINHSKQIILSELASDLGFSDQSHFQREFKKLTSTTPLKYQRQIEHTDYLNKRRCFS